MATTGSDFVYTTTTNPILVGSAVTSSPQLLAVGPKEAMSVSQLDQVAGGSGAAAAANSIVAGKMSYEPGLTAVPTVGSPNPVPDVYGTILAGYAKNGAVLLALSGTTAQTINFQDTTNSGAVTTAGDTVYANLNVIRVKNLGATATVTVSPGASNPSRLPNMGGTSPTYVIPAGSELLFHVAGGVVVDSTHNAVTFTPSATCNLLVTASGS